MKGYLLIALASLALVAACKPSPDSPRGFSLPKGDAEKGKQVFVRYQCLACHTMEGFDNDMPAGIPEKVRLGGETHRVRTYAELVTAVINPSHKIAKGYAPDNVSDPQGKSRMRNYNEVMTVQELTDLVAFLQPKYPLRPFRQTNYPRYMP